MKKKLKKPVIKLKNLTKSYGKNRGVENISLSLDEGEVFGFLGPNGAGKTTTISMLVNLMKQTSGSIEIFGLNNQEYGTEIRSRIGYLAADTALDKGLTGRQQLEYFGNLRGDYDAVHVDELANRLNCDLTRKIKTLSRGNRQKVGLIAALMHRPELLILDEPTSGLDPIIQAEFNKIILEHKTSGKTAFISSHVLSEVQELCDKVVFIREGRLIANKPLKDIVRSAAKHIRMVAPNTIIVNKIKNLGLIKNTHINGLTLSGLYDGEINSLLTGLAQFKLTDLSISDADLETVFMQYYEAKNV